MNKVISQGCEAVNGMESQIYFDPLLSKVSNAKTKDELSGVLLSGSTKEILNTAKEDLNAMLVGVKQQGEELGYSIYRLDQDFNKFVYYFERNTLPNKELNLNELIFTTSIVGGEQQVAISGLKFDRPQDHPIEFVRRKVLKLFKKLINQGFVLDTSMSMSQLRKKYTEFNIQDSHSFTTSVLKKYDDAVYAIEYAQQHFRDDIESETLEKARKYLGAKDQDYLYDTSGLRAFFEVHYPAAKVAQHQFNIVANSL